MKKEELKELNDDELIELFQELNDSIYEIECYGMSDLILLSWVLEEFEEREIELEI